MITERATLLTAWRFLAKRLNGATRLLFAAAVGLNDSRHWIGSLVFSQKPSPIAVTKPTIPIGRSSLRAWTRCTWLWAQ